MKYKARIQIGLVIFLAVVTISLFLSLNANPDMPPFFALKRVQENVFFKFKSTPAQKVDYMSNLLQTRLEELQNIVKNKSYNHILNASLRYSTLAGRITEEIIANNLTDKKEAVKNMFTAHQKLLDDLYVAYPKNTDNLEYKYIQDDFNYLGLYLDKLSQAK